MGGVLAKVKGVKERGSRKAFIPAAESLIITFYLYFKEYSVSKGFVRK